MASLEKVREDLWRRAMGLPPLAEYKAIVKREKAKRARWAKKAARREAERLAEWQMRQEIRAAAQAAWVRSSPERNDEIIRLRDAGETFKAIGIKFGISASAVQSMYKRMNSKRERGEKLEAHKRFVASLNIRRVPYGRPIDMGGSRDNWLDWTPEMQAREFGLIE